MKGASLAEDYITSKLLRANLKGEKPSDLRVQLATTAKAARITFPLTLLGRADEVIE